MFFLLIRQIRGLTVHLQSIAVKLYNKTVSNTTTIKYKSFVTLIFYKLVSPAISSHDNPSCRFDVLKTLVDAPPKKTLLSRILFWKKSDQHYAELKRIVSEIAIIDFIRLAPQENQNKVNPDVFKQNYEEFAKIINLYTACAHATSEQILSFQSAKKWIIRIIKWFLLILPASVLVYLAWQVTINSQQLNEGNVRMGFYTFILTALNPFITSLLQKFLK